MFYYFYVYGWFFCLYVHAPPMFLVSMESRRGHCFLWDWSYKRFLSALWVGNYIAGWWLWFLKALSNSLGVICSPFFCTDFSPSYLLFFPPYFYVPTLNHLYSDIHLSSLSSGDYGNFRLHQFCGYSILYTNIWWFGVRKLRWERSCSICLSGYGLPHPCNCFDRILSLPI